MRSAPFRAAFAFALPCMATAKAQGGSLPVPQQAGAAALGPATPSFPLQAQLHSTPFNDPRSGRALCRTWGRSSSSLLAAIMGAASALCPALLAYEGLCNCLRSSLGRLPARRGGSTASRAQ